MHTTQECRIAEGVNGLLPVKQKRCVRCCATRSIELFVDGGREKLMCKPCTDALKEIEKSGVKRFGPYF
jgi:hypothetical protein